MVLIKNTACVVLLFLCASWLSTARLINPSGAQVYQTPDIKVSIATSTTVKSLAAIDEGNMEKPNAKLMVSKSGKVKSSSNVEDKRNVRSHMFDEVNVDSVAFTADYRRPVHHPPKNNK
ncbi:hypothetical protein VNO77_39706 [Canavalia gladiata]|uniref:Uncharacterized protein n=1 Tax=Canavalia gladiata TaxID=3824 RepID=A0AAN9JZ01_CANGL